MKPNFKIEFLPEAVEFLENLDGKSRDKILYNLRKAQFLKDQQIFKKLNEVIWEFRTSYNGKSFRLFSFWDSLEDKEMWVVVSHGILKKTQKTPIKEIRKAEEIRKQFLEHRVLRK